MGTCLHLYLVFAQNVDWCLVFVHGQSIVVSSVWKMTTPAPPVVLPALTKESGVVIFLHHYGVNGLSWAKRFESMRLPHVKYIFPNAPVRPLSLYDGALQTAWYDVRGYTTSAPVDEEGLAQSTQRIQHLIDEEIARGTPSNRILLGGYSMGGGLAIYGTLTYGNPLAGCVAINCWIADYRWSVGEKFQQANLKTPILQIHGDGDPFIHKKYATLSREIAKKGGANYKLQLYKNSSHWPTDEMFEVMKKFIADHLPEIPSEQLVEQTSASS